MCGIFYLKLYGNPQDDSGAQDDSGVNRQRKILENFGAAKHRGPDVSTLIQNKDEVIGFHRLRINGDNGLSNQPMTLDGATYMICNGEIYNHAALEKRYGLRCTTGSDCEVILHMFTSMGFYNTIRALDGEFAVVIVTPSTVYAARDPYGVRALYSARNDLQEFGFASECKSLMGLFAPDRIAQVKPGTIQIQVKESNIFSSKSYFDYRSAIDRSATTHTAADNLQQLLVGAVAKRLMCSRRHAVQKDGQTRLAVERVPSIGAYLSGGFDSSAIAAILQKVYPGQLETFSIGFEDSPDLLYARKVAKFIGSKHHEYVITEEQALAAIPPTIKAIESYDTTTVRASTMMYLLSEYVSKNSKAVVMFSGEGSDEASGSYRYFYNAPSPEDFQAETLRLLQDLCYFDNLRADKSSAAWGLELRVPFLDLDFLKFYMTLPPELKTQNGVEKYLLREAMKGYLPDDVLYRPKEAMSDGVSLRSRSWSSIIQEEAKKITRLPDGLPAEKKYYKDVFLKSYPGCEHQIPYYWAPKWCGDVADPSARNLPFSI